MSKTLDRVRARPHVMHVDDERGDGNPIMIVLRDGFDFADDPGCGVRGVDTVAQAESVTRASNVIPSSS
ncbi:hypothetical protein [Paraburkholderia fungorum]|uniref:hypothetical protein n=1 Tax=Paraburkholderia fungorum TaxID=134537 RepID=UPI000FD7D512|nr:hypothetical protein [Paraburkholderia fungorum]MBB5546677.1 hypothetical protein [Paraburkholderia fungorum]